MAIHILRNISQAYDMKIKRIDMKITYLDTLVTVLYDSFRYVRMC